jgi:hypothetical protein
VTNTTPSQQRRLSLSPQPWREAIEDWIQISTPVLLPGFDRMIAKREQARELVAMFDDKWVEAERRGEA